MDASLSENFKLLPLSLLKLFTPLSPKEAVLAWDVLELLAWEAEILFWGGKLYVQPVLLPKYLLWTTVGGELVCWTGLRSCLPPSGWQAAGQDTEPAAQCLDSWQNPKNHEVFWKNVRDDVSCTCLGLGKGWFWLMKSIIWQAITNALCSPSTASAHVQMLLKYTVLIRDWLRLEGLLEIIYSHSLLKQGQLEQVAEDHVQSGFKCHW